MKNIEISYLFCFFFNNFTTISRLSRISRRVICIICNRLSNTVFDENTDHSPYTIDFIYKNSENVHKTVYSQYFWTSGKRVITPTRSHIISKAEVNQFPYSWKDTHFAIFFNNYEYFSNEWSSIVLKYVVLHITFFEYQFDVKCRKEWKSTKFWTSNLVKFVIDRRYYTFILTSIFETYISLRRNENTNILRDMIFFLNNQKSSSVNRSKMIDNTVHNRIYIPYQNYIIQTNGNETVATCVFQSMARVQR